MKKHKCVMVYNLHTGKDACMICQKDESKKAIAANAAYGKAGA